MKIRLTRILSFFVTATQRLDDDLEDYFKQKAEAEAAAPADSTAQAATNAQAAEDKKE